MDLNKLSFAELKAQIEKMEKNKESIGSKQVRVWNVGKSYVLRTVTMIDVGRLVEVTDNELVLESAAWIADTGRWNEFLKDGNYSECEPFPEGRVIVGRHALIDAVEWKHSVDFKVK